MGKKPEVPRKARIGILLTNSKNEGKKEEIISLRKRNPPRPWIKDTDFTANPDFKIIRKPYNLTYKQIKIPQTVGVATDVSIGEYIRHYHSNDCEVDYIRPKDISAERLAKNDINFLLIYDLLESFHTDRTKGKRLHNNFKTVVQNATNVFPNWKYQEFIDSKLLYYEYFRAHDIPIAPTLTLSREDYHEQVKKEIASGGEQGAARRVAAAILAKIEQNTWGKFIAKPVFGQEAKSCKSFKNASAKDVGDRFAKYITETYAKYPGLIFQKFIHGFGETTSCPELRMYFVGDTYHFSMIATRDRIYTLRSEGGKPSGRSQNGLLDLPKNIRLDALMEIARKVISVLKKKCTLQRPDGSVTTLPLLVTRVDMGCIQDGEFKPWVNEIEFVPSYYMEDHTHPLDGCVGEQAALIARKYLGMPEPQAPEGGLIKDPKPLKSEIKIPEPPKRASKEDETADTTMEIDD